MTTLAEDKNKKRLTVGARVSFTYAQDKVSGIVTDIDDAQKRCGVKLDEASRKSSGAALVDVEAYTVEII